MAIKIMLDAGHYAKYNRSPVVPEYWEIEMTWKLQGYLKAELETYGFEVGTTRKQQNKNLEVTRRGGKAKDYDLFISLHSNACGSENVDRVVGINMVKDDTTTIDDVSKELTQRFAVGVASLMQTKDTPRWYERRAATDRNRNGKLDDNYYGVLHGARQVNVPGFIIEHSFHTNKKATLWLLNDENLKALAVLEAEILADYYGLSKKQHIKGDANDDGIINSKDYLFAKRAALGTIDATPEQLDAIDINGNGKPDAKDYLMVKRHFLGTYKIKQGVN